MVSFEDELSVSQQTWRHVLPDSIDLVANRNGFVHVISSFLHDFGFVAQVKQLDRL